MNILTRKSLILGGLGAVFLALYPLLPGLDAMLFKATKASIGAELVSMNPVRDTLEDFFLAHVQQGPRRAFD